MFYSRRRRVINDIRRRVGDGTAKNEKQAIDQLEQLRGARSLDWLCKNLAYEPMNDRQIMTRWLFGDGKPTRR
jgi:hypothetical protein